MTAAEFAAARAALKMTMAELGRALELEGRDPGQTIRRYETGARAVPGPVRVAVRLMLAAKPKRPRVPYEPPPEARPAAPPITTRRRGA